MGGLERAPQAPRARRAPATRDAPRFCDRWGASTGPPKPPRSSRPGEPGALLDLRLAWGARRAPRAPRARRARRTRGAPRSHDRAGGLERAPRAPRARHAPANPGRSSISAPLGGLERAPPSPPLLVAPRGTRGATRHPRSPLGRSRAEAGPVLARRDGPPRFSPERLCTEPGRAPASSRARRPWESRRASRRATSRLAVAIARHGSSLR